MAACTVPVPDWTARDTAESGRGLCYTPSTKRVAAMRKVSTDSTVRSVRVVQAVRVVPSAQGKHYSYWRTRVFQVLRDFLVVRDILAARSDPPVLERSIRVFLAAPEVLEVRLVRPVLPILLRLWHQFREDRVLRDIRDFQVFQAVRSGPSVLEGRWSEWLERQVCHQFQVIQACPMARVDRVAPPILGSPSLRLQAVRVVRVLQPVRLFRVVRKVRGDRWGPGVRGVQTVRDSQQGPLDRDCRCRDCPVSLLFPSDRETPANRADREDRQDL